MSQVQEERTYGKVVVGDVMKATKEERFWNKLKKGTKIRASMLMCGNNDHPYKEERVIYDYEGVVDYQYPEEITVRLTKAYRIDPLSITSLGGVERELTLPNPCYIGDKGTYAISVDKNTLTKEFHGNRSWTVYKTIVKIIG